MSVPLPKTYSDLGISLQFSQYDTPPQWDDMIDNAFNCEWVGWQFGCFAVKAPFAYKAIRLHLNYSNNANIARFSNVFLHKEQFGSSFAYDANKNLLSASTLAGQKSDLKYDAYDNLISYVQPGRNTTDDKYVMTYGTTAAQQKKHLLLTMTTPENVKSVYTYDAYGNRTSSTTQNSAGTLRIQSDTTYIDNGAGASDNGNYPASITDARGNTATQIIDRTTGTLSSATDPASQSVAYQYDACRRVTGVSATVGANTYRNAYTYNKDRIETVGHNTTGSSCDVYYKFEYDALGRQKKVRVGNTADPTTGQELSSNTYSGSDRDGLLTEVDYGNDNPAGTRQRIINTYDDFNRLTGISYDGDATPRYTYEYGANGAAAEVSDAVLNRKRTVEYDLANRPMQSTLRDTQTGAVLYKTTLQYNAYNNLSTFKEKVGSSEYQTGYTYDTENRPLEIKYMNDANKTVTYAYDTLKRPLTRTIKNGASCTAATTYTYVHGRSDVTNSTTPLVASISQPGVSFAYEYDTRGNITKETRTPQGGTAKEITYVYDNLGQLTRANDPTDTTSGASGTTWVYAYDLGGNITSKTRYAYTTETLGTAQETIAYAYGDANWKDKLTSYDGQTITYDAIGNTTDDGTWTYTWHAGRQLATMAKKNTTENYEFKYNDEGLRVQKIKKNGNTVVETTDYTLHGECVAHLKKGVDNLHFFYDAQGRPAIVRYNGVDYHYMHNLQGDITEIVDGSGTLVVEYKYDAWGRATYCEGTLKTTLGTQNPFRYRGYVYDEESELYYLANRYYNPEICRFINQDIVLGKSGTLLTHNMFTYCGNCPICLRDRDGKGFWSSILDFATSVVDGFTSGEEHGLVAGIARGIVTVATGVAVAAISTLIITAIPVGAAAAIAFGVLALPVVLLGNLAGEYIYYDIINDGKLDGYIRDNSQDMLMLEALTGSATSLVDAYGSMYLSDPYDVLLIARDIAYPLGKYSYDKQAEARHKREIEVARGKAYFKLRFRY